jgi:hypothetical protein
MNRYFLKTFCVVMQSRDLVVKLKQLLCRKLSKPSRSYVRQPPWQNELSQPHQSNAASIFPNLVGKHLEQISQRLEAIEIRGQQSEMPKPTCSRTRGLRDWQRQNDDKIGCRRCEGKFSHSLQDCPAFGKTCLFCNGKNHCSETCYKRKNEDKLKSQQ